MFAWLLHKFVLSQYSRASIKCTLKSFKMRPTPLSINHHHFSIISHIVERLIIFVFLFPAMNSLIPIYVETFTKPTRDLPPTLIKLRIVQSLHCQRQHFAFIFHFSLHLRGNLNGILVWLMCYVIKCSHNTLTKQSTLPLVFWHKRKLSFQKILSSISFLSSR